MLAVLVVLEKVERGEAGLVRRNVSNQQPVTCINGAVRTTVTSGVAEGRRARCEVVY